MPSSSSPWGVMPYNGEADKKCSFFVKNADIKHLQTICPQHGFITFLLQHAIKSAADYARANKLVYDDEAKLIAFVRGNGIGLRDNADSRAVEGTAARVKPRKGKRVHTDGQGSKD